MPQGIGTPALWGGVAAFILLMLALDLGVFHREPRAPGFRGALGWSVLWISLGLLFDLGLGLRFGRRPAEEFLSAYLTEEALSVDNLFVFLVLFAYFSVAPEVQRRVLFWGILGAVFFRSAFILGMVQVVNRFRWVFYLMGAFLVFTGARLLLRKGEEVRPERNPVLRLFKRLVPMTLDYRGAAFLVREGGRLLATPLLLVLAVVEVSDILFAFDSVPAAVSVVKSRDPFIILTSNVFAVLGLRSLFFVLAGSMAKFRHLKTGVALVLAFVGGKMVLEEAGFCDVPTGASLGVIVAILSCGILASWRKPIPEGSDR